MTKTQDVITITKWEAPDEPGVKILTMPNVPYPTHNLAPRTVLGRKVWDEMRRKCYDDAGHRCEVCGAEGVVHAHELYDIDYENQTVTFNRCVCLCPLCHLRCIHTGRALTLYKKNSPLMTRSALLEGAEHCFKLIHDYNSVHRSSEPLRVFSAWLDYAKQPELTETMEDLFKKYEVKFYKVQQKWYDSKHWRKWKLIIDGKEYPTPYASVEEWQKAMEKNNKKRTPEVYNPFKGGIYDEVEKILQEWEGKEKNGSVKIDNL